MANSGWYNDEHDRTLARWHDGAAWTEHTVVKSEWEAVGRPPPPPAWEPAPLPAWEAGRDGRRSRVWAAVGSAAVAALAIGGVALAGDDGGGGGAPPDGERSSIGGDQEVDRSTGQTADDVAEGLGGTSTSDPAAGTEPESGTAGGAGSTSSRRAGTTATTAGSSVRRTESSTRTQTNPGPITAGPATDKISVGNTTNTSISSTYTPPPPTTEPPPTETTEPPTETTTTGIPGDQDGSATDG